MLLEIYIEYI